jgi:hypothetical protein
MLCLVSNHEKRPIKFRRVTKEENNITINLYGLNFNDLFKIGLTRQQYPNHINIIIGFVEHVLEAIYPLSVESKYYSNLKSITILVPGVFEGKTDEK